MAIKRRKWLDMLEQMKFQENVKVVAEDDKPIKNSSGKVVTPMDHKNALEQSSKKTTTKTSSSNSKKKEEKDFLDSVGYTFKSLGSGVLKGGTGLVQAVNTEIADNLEKGENSKKSIAETALSIINPTKTQIDTMLNTSAEIAHDIWKDENKSAWQKIAGTVTTGISGVSDIIMAPLNNTIQGIGAVLPDDSNEKVMEFNETISAPSKKLQEELAVEAQEYGTGTQIAGDVANIVGVMIPSIATTVITKNPSAGLAVMGVSTKGMSTQEALDKGVKLDEAIAIGDTKAVIEVGSEMLTGGVPIFGKGALDDIVEKGIDKKVKNEVANFFVQKGAGIAGEVLEETISDTLNTVIDKGTVDSEATYTLEDFGDTALKTMLSTAVINLITFGYGSGAYNANATRLQNNTNEQAVIEAEVESRVNELQEKTGKELTKKEIAKVTEQVENDLQKGYISTDTIENTFLAEDDAEITALQERLAQETDPKSKADIQSLIHMNELNRQTNLDNLLKNNQYFQESYNEKARKTQDFTYEASEKLSEQRKTIYESAKELGLNNTNKTHETIDFYAKIAEDRKTNYKLVNNAKLEELGYSVEGATIDGLVTGKNGEVLINIESPKALNKVVGHETTHLLEGTEEYKHLQDFAIEYAKTKGDYQARVDTLKKVYKGINADLKNELTSDIVGEYLFTDEQFINDLSVQKPNVFQKVYNYIKHLYKMATAGSTEARQLEQLKYKFEKAYNKNVSNNNNADTKYSVSKDEIIKAIYENVPNRTSKENQRNNKRIQTFLDEKYPDLVIGFTNYKTDGEVIIHSIKTREEFENRMREYNERMKRAEEERAEERRRWAEIPESEKIEFKYNERPELDSKEWNDLEDIRNRIEKLVDELNEKSDDYDISYEESHASLDATYISLENNEGDFVTIRVANHTDSTGTSAYHLYLSNYKTKTDLINDLRKLIEDVRNGRADTKYSLTDNKGRTLTKEQQEYFKDSKVRDENGNLLRVYHGSKSDFTIFDKEKIGLERAPAYGEGFYFSSSRSDAKGYSKDGKLYSVYLDIKNPYIAKWEDIGKLKREELIKQGYDGVLINHADNKNFVVFEPNQIKNVDNTKPTSNPDIRYSLSKDGSMIDEKGNKVTLEASDTGRTLMAIHNLTEEKLKGILELGGFPLPSIAVINTLNTNHDNFGDISVLFDKNTIDPQLNRKNKVFSRDAYTARFPSVEYKVNKDVTTNLYTRVSNLDDYKNNPYISDAHNFISNMESNLNRWGDIESVIKQAKNDYALKYVYLKENNIPFETAYKENNYSYDVSNKALQQFLDTYTGDKNKLNNLSSEEIMALKDTIEEIYINDKFTAEELEILKKHGKGNKIFDFGFNKLEPIVFSAYKLYKYGSQQVVDKKATNEFIDNAIDEADYEKWLYKQFENVVEKKGLRNDKDLFTPSGNRRSFEQLHDEYNLDNVVKLMTAKDDTGSENGIFTGFNRIAGVASKRFNSIQEIKNNQDMLQDLTEEEYTAKIEELSDRLTSIAKNIASRKAGDKASSWDLLDYIDSAMYGFQEVARKLGNGRSITTNDVFKELTPYGYNITESEAQEVIEILKDTRNLPTRYFEAKPLRAVGLHEVQAIVVPNKVSAELKQQLHDNGLNVIEYDPNIEGDRQAKINALDDLKFSLSPKNQDIAPTGSYEVYGRDLLKQQVEEAIAPLQEQIRDLTNQLARDTLSVQKVPETPNVEEIAPLNVMEKEQDIDSIAQNEIAPIAEDTTPDTMPDTTVESLFDTRNYEEVGDRKINAYQYDNPEVKPFFQEVAQEMLYDLENTTKGERGYNDQAYYDSNGENGWYGTERQTTDDIAELLDGMDGRFKLSYDQIRKGLNAIIKDEGAENNVASKRIEFYIEKRLLEGYTNVDGMSIPANQDYITLKKAKQATEHNTEISSTLSDKDIPYVEAEPAPITPKIQKGNTNTTSYAKMPENQNMKAEKNKGFKIRSDEEITANVLADEQKTVKDKNKRTPAIILANIVDKGLVFENLALRTKNRDLQGKWDYTLTSGARGQYIIGKGHFDKGTHISKSLNSIIEEVGNTGYSNAFSSYMYHLLNIDRMTLKERHGIDNKPVFGESVTADKSREIVKEYESKFPKFKEFAQDVYEYVNADRDLLVKDGVISEQTAELWSKMYPHYVPIRRVGHEGNAINVPLDTKRTGINAPIQKATGGNSDILPMFDTIALRTLQIQRATAKNNFGLELERMLNTSITSKNDTHQITMDEILDSIDNQDKLLQKGDDGNLPTFTVFKNGEKITFEITEDMYDALSPLSDSSLLGKTSKILNTANNIRRGLLTEYNPVFWLTNAVKDVQDVLLNSQHATKTYAKIPEAYAQLVKKGYWYKEYVANGGEQNSYFDSQDISFTKESLAHRIYPLKKISDLNNFIEMAPRLAEYIASREAGRSIETSMLDASRVTTNFKAGGDLTKFLNRNGFTFLNASVQGAMQQVRNVREANANGLRGWANLATKYAIAGLPALILNGLLWGDDDEYEELSDYVKQSYYIVGKNEDGTFIRIPKGRAVAVIQEAFNQMGNLITGNDEADLKSFLDLVVNNLAPNNPLENNLIAPVIQAVNNKTWYGGDLVPSRLQDLPEAEQFDESTDSFSKWLGEMINVSPVKINYLIDQYSGGVGDVILPMLTPEAENGSDSLLGDVLAPFNDKFTTNSTLNNQNVSDFYDLSDELTTEAKKSKATDEDIVKNKYINSVKSEMNELYKQKREVQNSDLSDSEKYDKVLEIQSQINSLAKEALSGYSNVSVEENYSKVEDREYRINNNGEWTKITDDQLEKQNKVTNALGITPNEYWSDRKEEYDYAYEKPAKYTLATTIADYNTYKGYTGDLYDLKADKDEDGKSISGSRKEKVIEYVNNLDIDYGQRLLLFKSEYKADDSYNYDIIDYLNERDDIDFDEMKTILEELDFTVTDDGDIYWD